MDFYKHLTFFLLYLVYLALAASYLIAGDMQSATFWLGCVILAKLELMTK